MLDDIIIIMDKTICAGIISTYPDVVSSNVLRMLFIAGCLFGLLTLFLDKIAFEKKRRPIIISIEGNIGTGKSTLIAKVQEHFQKSKLNIKFGYIPEPVNVWNSVTDDDGVTILEKYYGNQKKYAFSFQMMAYISRLSIMRKAIQLEEYDIIIVERSIFTDCEVFAKMLYADGKIEPIEYNIYMKWFNEFIGDLPNIWHIYIQADPLVSAERVLKRGRQGENIPLSYLETCHEYHENWLLKNQNVPTLLLDGNQNMEEADYADWLEKIAEFIIPEPGAI